MCVWGGGGGGGEGAGYYNDMGGGSRGNELGAGKPPTVPFCWYKQAVVCIVIMYLSQVRAGQWLVYFVPRGECVSGDLPLVLSTPQA